MTFLLSEGLDRVRIRRHLLVFAAAAPITALLTFFGLSQQVRFMMVEYIVQARAIDVENNEDT